MAKANLQSWHGATMTRLDSLCLALVFALSLFGCATADSNITLNDGSAAVPPQSSEGSATGATFAADQGDVDRLVHLWNMRSKEKITPDYPVGRGDILEVSVPSIEELRSRTVRISGDGTISLPFIGRTPVAGLTEDELQQALVERLKKYMYNPRVVVFVKEYRSRQVAVLGSVVRPGLYSVTSGTDTILDMISQAGGIASGADTRIYLIPAEPAENGSVRKITATLPESLLRQDPTPLILKRTDPILIDIKQLAFGGFQQYLSLAVRPGDVIMVPGAGQVLIEGWVERPGAYKVSPGLTVAGAVVEAGGLLFPADVGAVKVIRTDRGGSKSFIVADLERIKRGETKDITLQGGDIVEVSAQTSKLIPYGLYRFFSTIINVGIGGTVPIVR